MKILFIGDVVGNPAIEFLEAHLEGIIRQTEPDAVIANGENASVTGPVSVNGFGLTECDLERLLALGIEVVTLGNHAWDGPDYEVVLAHPAVLRPINQGPYSPGRGATVIETLRGRLGVINVAGRSAIPLADDPCEAVEAQLAAWDRAVDSILVDMHGDHLEKQIFAARLDGQVAAVVGTHTHIPTLDAQLLPRGTAYVTEVGMVGPTGGVLGVDPDYFREWSRRRVKPARAFALAQGPMAFGAVLIEAGERIAQSISRVGSSYRFDGLAQATAQAQEALASRVHPEAGHPLPRCWEFKETL